MPEHLSLHAPLWLWGLAALPLLLVGPVRRPRAERLGAVAAALVRCVALAAVLLALADFRWSVTRDRVTRPPVVVLEDRSASLAGEASVEQAADAIRRGVPSGRATDYGYFAAAPYKPGEPAADAQQTDIERALDTAAGTRGDVGGVDVVLLTDGRPTRGDAAAAAGRLAARGAHVHVVPVGPTGPAVQIVSVEPPIDANIGKPATVRVTVRSAVPTDVTLDLSPADGSATKGGGEGATRTIPLDGEATVLLRCTPDASGVARYAVAARPAGTTDGSGATTRPVAFDVAGPPRVLVVDRVAAEARPLVEALAALRMPIDVATPERMPPGLGQYAAVVLDDLTGGEFTPEQRVDLKTFVEDRGSGLVFVGGSATRSLSWNNNPLASLLPVKLKEPPAKIIAKPPEVAVCFVIDVSGSMGGVLPGPGGLSKLDLVKRAVIASLDALPKEARVSVIAFDNQPTLAVDAASVLNKDLIAKIVDGIGVGGGTNIFPAVDFGLDHLAQQAGEKFVVVLTDGRSMPPPRGADWRDLSTKARAGGVQWTSIAVGSDADQGLLKSLSGAAGGTFHYCETSDDVPRVFIDQADKVRRSAERPHDPFPPVPGPDAVDLGALATANMPIVGGAVPADTRTGARVQLIGDKGQPLLSSWQAGAGRVAVFCGGVKPEWAKDWLAWKEFAAFWSGVVGRVAFAPPPLHASVRSATAGDRTRLSFDVVAEDGRPADRLTPSVTALDGPAPTVRWQRPRPGRYVADVVSTAVSTVRLSLTSEGGKGNGGGGGIDYVATLAAPPGEATARGVDAAACAALAAAGDGVCGDAGTVVGHLGAPERRVNWTEVRPLWPYLLLAAVLVWPVDVWVRKAAG